MGLKRRQHQHNGPKRRKRRWSFVMAIALLAYGGYRYWQYHSLQPDAMLVLGGAEERERFAADFAQENPDLPIWVSSGSNQEYAEWIFSEAGIQSDRIHLDYQAVDTVTNFTTLVDDFQAAGIESVYVITSDYHMRRAWLIGKIVFGSQGIQFKPVMVGEGRQPEPLRKALRDGVRSLLWVTTGRTGTSLGHILLETHESSLPDPMD